jgi:glycosyltransferase involved in cell wall biosynthesis
VAVIGGLSDEKFLSKIEPLVKLENVEKVYLCRWRGNVLAQYDKVQNLWICEHEIVCSNHLLRVLHDVICMFRLVLLTIHGKVDLFVGVYLYPYGLYAGVLAKLFSKPFVLVTPGSDLREYTASRKGQRIFKSASFIGVRGSDSKDKLSHMGFDRQKIFVLHNVLHKIVEPHQIAAPSDIHYDLIYTGYLRKLKRIDVLIKVVLQLKCMGFDSIKCAIVGDGAEKKKLIELAERLNVLQNIDFIGYTDNVGKYLKRAKIFVLTSESEGLPMSIIEAMAFSLPVVSSSVNDIPDIVDHSVTGYLVNPNDIEGFSGYIYKLLVDEPLRVQMSLSSYNKVASLYESSFSFDSIMNVWRTILLRAKTSADHN